MKQTYMTVGLIAVGLLFAGAACQKPASQPANQTLGTNQTATTLADETLTLSNLGGVMMAKHVAGASKAGDISMSKTYLDAGAGRIVPVFMFGQSLPGRTTTQLNPNLEFGGLAEPVTVVAAIDGVVGFVREQAESSDYEVFLQPLENSTWTIGYDHLTDVTVKQGDRVTVGQVLGQAARENNGLYRYELQVNRDVNGVTTFHCPTELLRSDLKATTVASLEQFIQDWNVFYGSNAYGQVTSSCSKPTLSLSETQ